MKVTKISEKLKSRIYRFLPGLRMQLTLLTALLVGFVVFFFHLWLSQKQSKELSQKLFYEMSPLLEAIKNLWLEQNQVERSLSQMEEMRQKIREWPKGKTYYSQYFPLSHLDPVEREVLAQLRSPEGRLLTKEEAKAFIDARKKVITRKITQKEEVVWNPLEWFQSGLTRKVKEVKKIEKIKAIRDVRKEKEAFRESLQVEGRQKLNLFNFDTAKYRVQLYDKKANLLFDSVKLEYSNKSPVNQLNLNTGSWLAHFNEKVKKIKQKQIEIEEYDNLSFEINQDQAIRFADFFVDILGVPEIAERSLAVLDYLKKWQEKDKESYLLFVEKEKLILDKIKQKAEEIKKHLAFLEREKPKEPPGKDKVYQKLYQEYLSFVQEKKKLYQEMIRPEEKRIQILEDIKEQKKKLIQEKQKLEKATEDKKREKLAEIQNKLIRIEEEEEKLSYELKNFFYSKSLFTLDAFLYLADFVFANAITLRFRYDPISHRNYLRSPEEREKEQTRLSHLRNWIALGQNELEIPLYSYKNKKEKAIKNGVLLLRRLEAEQVLWQKDSLPIEKLAQEVLSDSVYEGFVRFVADLADFFEVFRREKLYLNLQLFAIGLVGIFLSFWVSNLFSRRIIKLAKEAEAAGLKGQLDIEFKSTGWDEVSLLKKSLNEMLQNLRRSEELRQEIHAASEIQKRLLPQKIPAPFHQYLDIAMYYQAMGSVGGDYFDFLPTVNGELAICIGDVSNHGLGPALIMSNLSAQIKILVNLTNVTPLKIVARLNDLLYQNTPEEMYVTFFLAFYNKNTQKLTYISCAHTDGLLLRKNGEEVLLEGMGLPLGLSERAEFLASVTEREILIQKGDLLFHYTDGLTEARVNRQMFGFSRLKEILQKEKDKKSNEILTRVSQELEKFLGQGEKAPDLQDDVAMIAIKF